jgi:hypothetical protein
MTTLVFMRHGQVGSRHFQCGEELPPGLLPPEVVAHWLDERWLAECDPTERPSLYRVLHRFSGCKEEQPLTKEQIARYALDE